MHASSLPLPGGTVRARHGLLPAPAPATLEILARVGAPTRPAPVLGELVTPTGAAILAELATFEQPTMRVRRVGYGYGTKELPWPNAVRVWLGEPWAPGPPRLPAMPSTGAVNLTPPAPFSGADRGEQDSVGAGFQLTAPSSPNPDLPRPSHPVDAPDHPGSRPSPTLSDAEQGPVGRGLHADEVVVIEANL